MDQFFQSIFGGNIGRRRRSRGRNNEEHQQQPVPGVFGFDFDSIQTSFGDLFAHAPQSPRGPAPPASKTAIRQLPTILVTPEDLVDENNRECCICLEENHLKDRVTRLPCAHIYHPKCILDWLQKHCTCPVCRYELPTDDATYERGRLERMKHYKPRFAQYELDRMSIPELQTFANQLSINTTGVVPKQELVDKIIKSDKIDLVAAPTPVEYPLSLLRAMGVGELRRCMADAGVFFDPVDVVEKEDMVVIFINSGRLEIAPEQENVLTDEESDLKQPSIPTEHKRDTTPKKPKQKEVLVETVEESDEETEQGGRKMSSTAPYFMDYNESFVEPPPPHSETTNLSGSVDSDTRGSRQETVVDCDHGDGEDEPVMSAAAAADNTVETSHSEEVGEASPSEVSDNEMGYAAASMQHGSSDESPSAGHNNGQESTTSQTSHQEAAEGPATLEVTDKQTMERHSSDEATPQLAADDHDSVIEDDDGDVVMEDVFEAPSVVQESPEECVSSNTSPPLLYQDQSIAELRGIARRLQIDISDCIERSEMVDRLVNAPPAADNEAALVVQAGDFDSWTVSGLRGAGGALGIDMSRCTDRTSFVTTLVEAAGANPRVASYLIALAPLGRLSVSELRAVAREWHVNISDCLEKGEMMNRLVLEGPDF